MASSFSINAEAIFTGQENYDIPEDFELPACGVEDVDRAIFNLFDKEIPFYYELDGEQQKIPAVFATGERAFTLRRKKPLRDRQGALMLPMISILKSGLEQGPEGIFQAPEGITIKKKISSENYKYKRRENIEGLKNQINVTQDDQHVGLTNRKLRDSYIETSLTPSSNNIYEIIKIPRPKFFNVTYEITFWSQYQQQMNDMIEVLMLSPTWGPQRTFKLETDKGYWFVANADASLSLQNNYDGMIDQERLVKTSFNIKVRGYIINPKIPGVNNQIRRYISAPYITFDMGVVETQRNPLIVGKPHIKNKVNVPSSNLNDYVHENIEHVDDPLPGSSIGNSEVAQKKETAQIGINMAGEQDYYTYTEKDPNSGKEIKKTYAIKTTNRRKGETVYREFKF